MSIRTAPATGTAARRLGNLRTAGIGERRREPCRAPEHADPLDGSSGRVFRSTEWDWLSGQLHLSPRELDVVRHIFRGHSEARAAYLMEISTDTVHTYVRRAYAKVGVHDQKELILHIVRIYLDHFVRNARSRPKDRPEFEEEPKTGATTAGDE